MAVCLLSPWGGSNPPKPDGLPGTRALWYWRGRETDASRQQGSGMKIDPAEGHPAMDYAEHERTYKLFTKLTVYLIISVVVLMALLAIFVV